MISAMVTSHEVVVGRPTRTSHYSAGIEQPGLASFTTSSGKVPLLNS